MKFTTLIKLGLFSTGLLVQTAFGASATANLTKEGVILCDKKGNCYDAVSYFDGKPLKGLSSIKVEREGITYLFANEVNKNKFLENPTKYAPAYEGWCATAVVKNKKYAIDPLNFGFDEKKERIFFFYRESGLFGGDAKPDWDKNVAENIKTADKNWPGVRNQKE